MVFIVQKKERSKKSGEELSFPTTPYMDDLINSKSFMYGVYPYQEEVEALLEDTVQILVEKVYFSKKTK